VTEIMCTDIRVCYHDQCVQKAETAKFLILQIYNQLNCRWGVKLTTHLHLELRLRMCQAIPPLPHISSCCASWLSSGFGLVAWYLVKCRVIFALPIHRDHTVPKLSSCALQGDLFYILLGYNFCILSLSLVIWFSR